METYLQDTRQFERRQRVLERIATAMEHQAHALIWANWKVAGDGITSPPISPKHRYNCTICNGDTTGYAE